MRLPDHVSPDAQSAPHTPEHPVQELMSRTGSFPLAVPYALIQRYAPKGGTVLDPFCGKGTSLLAGRLLGRSVYGLDVAPEAVVCSEAKLQHLSLDEMLAYVERLPIGPAPAQRYPGFAGVFFHPHTLRQLIPIRDALLHDLASSRPGTRSKAVMAMAALLGILHGHASYSLSVSCAHAYSMSPGYVRRYARENGLKRPSRDVRSCLARKLARCLRRPLPPPVEGTVRLGSALRASEVFPELEGQVDLVVTSPPYLAAQTYAKDNWLRLWVLGYDHRRIRPDYIETHSLTTYRAAMLEAFRGIVRLMRPGARLICVAGDVTRRRRTHAGLQEETVSVGDLLADICESDGLGVSVEHLAAQHVPSRRRYFHSLTTSNGHSARDLVERVLVARKSGPGRSHDSTG